MLNNDNDSFEIQFRNIMHENIICNDGCESQEYAFHFTSEDVISIKNHWKDIYLEMQGKLVHIFQEKCEKYVSLENQMKIARRSWLLIDWCCCWCYCGRSLKHTLCDGDINLGWPCAHWEPSSPKSFCLWSVVLARLLWLLSLPLCRQEMEINSNSRNASPSARLWKKLCERSAEWCLAIRTNAWWVFQCIHSLSFSIIHNATTAKCWKDAAKIAHQKATTLINTGKKIASKRK